MRTSKTYIPVLNSLRGLAATAICFYHFVLSTANYVEETWVRTVFYYAQYGVPLFFVIKLLGILLISGGLPSLPSNNLALASCLPCKVFIAIGVSPAADTIFL